MEKRFNRNNFIINLIIPTGIILILAVFIPQSQNMPLYIGLYICPLIYIIIGGFFNKEKFLSLFQNGKLVLETDNLIIAMILFLLLLSAIGFGIPFLSQHILKYLTLNANSLVEPYFFISRRIIPLFFGYFAAGTFYKTKEEK